MYHKLTLVGNVGRDAEMRFTPSGQQVTSFSVAANRQYTQNGEKVKETIWFKVTTWGKQAEICSQYVKKGMAVLVEGRLNADPASGGPRIWDNKGTPAASFEVTAEAVRFLTKTEQQEQRPSLGLDDYAHGAPQPDDGIPF
jgi:single-strand DNA-binding protein